MILNRFKARSFRTTGEYLTVMYDLVAMGAISPTVVEALTGQKIPTDVIDVASKLMTAKPKGAAQPVVAPVVEKPAEVATETDETDYPTE